ncbi:hypothetical protein BDR26DRAFT_575751 [Obelidium mucronatum]|nr:hypothetical protein BDR26DRAFT_575751 [Obelidium mucronatum]
MNNTNQMSNSMATNIPGRVDSELGTNFGMSLPQLQPNSYQFNSYNDFGLAYNNGGQPPASMASSVNKQFQDLFLSSSLPRADSFYSSSVPNNVFFGGIATAGTNMNSQAGSAHSLSQFLPGSFGSESGFNLLQQRQQHQQQQQQQQQLGPQQLSGSLGGLPPHMIFSKQQPSRRTPSNTVLEEDEDGKSMSSSVGGGIEDGEGYNSNDSEDVNSMFPSSSSLPTSTTRKQHRGSILHRQLHTGAATSPNSTGTPSGLGGQPPQRNSFTAESRLLHQPKLSVGSVGSNGMSGRGSHFNLSPHQRKRRNSASTSFDISSIAAGDSRLSSSLKNASIVHNVDTFSDMGGVEGIAGVRESMSSSAPAASLMLSGSNALPTMKGKSLLSGASSGASSNASLPSLGTSPALPNGGMMSMVNSGDGGAGGRSREFLCSVCQKPFMRRQDLRRHEQTHLGIKAYTCPLGCGTNFSRSDALQRHLKARRCQ